MTGILKDILTRLKLRLVWIDVFNSSYFTLSHKTVMSYAGYTVLEKWTKKKLAFILVTFLYREGSTPILCWSQTSIVDLRSLFMMKQRGAATNLLACKHISSWNVIRRLLEKHSIYMTRKSKQHWHLLLDILIADSTKPLTFQESCLRFLPEEDTLLS